MMMMMMMMLMGIMELRRSGLEHTVRNGEELERVDEFHENKQAMAFLEELERSKDTPQSIQCIDFSCFFFSLGLLTLALLGSTVVATITTVLELECLTSTITTVMPTATTLSASCFGLRYIVLLLALFIVVYGLQFCICRRNLIPFQ